MNQIKHYVFLLLCSPYTVYANSFEDLFNQGNSFHYQQQFAQAIDCYTQALKIKPNDAPTYFNKGLTHSLNNQSTQALEDFKNAILHDPHYAKAYRFLIKTLLQQKEYCQALFYTQSYLKTENPDLEVLEKIGQAALTNDDLVIAEKIFRKITQINPENSTNLNTFAYILSRINKNHEAITYYKATLAKDPENDNAHLGLSKALLATGNFTEGWYEFEWRLARRQDYQKAFGYLQLKPHQLKGRRVLIRAEWGLGDMVQFVRYAQLLKKEGAHVFLQSFDPLIKLFERCDFLDGIIGTSTPIPSVDYHIPLMSLPLVFNTTTETIPAHIPYIFADPILIEYWQHKLTSNAKLKIGLCWHAKPIYIEDHLFTRRSVPLEAFIPLASDSIDFYSLQKEFGTDEVEKITSSPLHIHTFDQNFDNTHGRFADTAAVIMNLDLVITADTSIVHVAGALGKQVWVLLPYTAEWRWLPSYMSHEQSYTPWYPNNMKLFKQTEPGNWNTVIDDVKRELSNLLNNK